MFLLFSFCHEIGLINCITLGLIIWKPNRLKSFVHTLHSSGVHIRTEAIVQLFLFNSILVPPLPVFLVRSPSLTVKQLTLHFAVVTKIPKTPTLLGGLLSKGQEGTSSLFFHISIWLVFFFIFSSSLKLCLLPLLSGYENSKGQLQWLFIWLCNGVC